MKFNINNFINISSQRSKIVDFQDLDHIDGVSISAVSAGLYKVKRDEVVLFYFRDGANYASVFTQSNLISENLKWNKKIKAKKIYALLVNTRNANALTGPDGYDALKRIALDLSHKLTQIQQRDEDVPKKISSKEILFGCTGTIGEKFPLEKIKLSLNELVNKIKYTQNKLIWMKAAMGIITTDLKPKVAMTETKIGSSTIKVYGIAKGSGMIYPNMATTLGYIFTDASLPSSVLKDILKQNVKTTFNAISCDGDTSTNDMISIFSTNKVQNPEIKKFSDKRIINFNKAVHEVLLNLAKQVVSDGEGASKLISINCINCKSEKDAKNISFKIANSLLVKTAIFGEDPNWGRIAMAIGNSNTKINEKKLSISIGPYKIYFKGSLYKNYDEKKVIEYMRGQLIEIEVDIGQGNKKFKAYTMDLTKKYIEINGDYRT
ncbi:bifunctional glutamate N-acetyltransferase/amino-acid acetyltransferase ArgJ [Candidatus Pelagibacter sp.]|nr:bifunctional glutamate N-acetyltransferase/amino-acid acetyltransferase ArgJ [Candidatus Pelagibacter sp.]